MLQVNFDETMLRQMIKEEVTLAVREAVKTKELPPFLTRQELMELLHIGQTKTSELLGRPDFPVFREAGILIPTKQLFEWIEKNMSWIEKETKYLSVI